MLVPWALAVRVGVCAGQDPRNALHGLPILASHDFLYQDQPQIVVQNHEWCCVLTTASTHEGQGGQRVRLYEPPFRYYLDRAKLNGQSVKRTLSPPSSFWMSRDCQAGNAHGSTNHPFVTVWIVRNLMAAGVLNEQIHREAGGRHPER